MLAYCDHLSGLTGGLLLGALIDAGADRTVLETGLSEHAGLDLTITSHRHRVAEVDAVCASIKGAGGSTLSTFKDALTIGRAAPGQTRMAEVLGRLGEAGGQIYGVAPEELTLDQVGGPETVFEIMAVCTALDHLHITQLFHTTIPLTGGLARTTPLMAALLRNIRIHMVDQAPMDLAGTALLTTLSSSGEAPAFTLHEIGYGGHPGEDTSSSALLRLCIGETDTNGSDDSDSIQVIETQIDDMNPQYYGYLVDRLLDAGALDAFLTSVIMKKGRPGTLLTVLAGRDHLKDITALILRETTTIGVRTYPAKRHILPRRIVAVDTAYGAIRIKIVRHGDRRRYTPEYDDCVHAAQGAGVPLTDVYAAVHAAAEHIDLDSLL